MSCFARVAANATAIEMDRAYCKKLAQRQEAVSGGMRHLAAASPPTQPLASLGRFDIVCSMYERAPRAIFAAADYVTWWIGGLKMNTQVLRYLHSMRAALRPNLEAIIVHDLHTGIVRRQQPSTGTGIEHTRGAVSIFLRASLSVPAACPSHVPGPIPMSVPAPPVRVRCLGLPKGCLSAA